MCAVNTYIKVEFNVHYFQRYVSQASEHRISITIRIRISIKISISISFCSMFSYQRSQSYKITQTRSKHGIFWFSFIFSHKQRLRPFG